MRDISGRLKRYRLSRYAPPEDLLRRRMHWAWWGLALWVLWASLLSEHGFYRLWQLRRENQRTQVELHQAERELQRLDGELRDPDALRGLAERVLREKNGMARPGEIVYRIQAPDSSVAQ
jgi:cell division protein FtsB